MEITDELVAHIARLSRLAISPAEARELKGHFQKILHYVETLDTVDVSAVDPSIFPLSITNVFREDEPRPSLPVEEALRNAPASRDGFFIVPRIVADASKGAAADEAGEPEESA
jgi:aspartyl-tRNA(Asn)/glutamyl-tRNA(Gln) amidotransferase subunit C